MPSSSNAAQHKNISYENLNFQQKNIPYGTQNKVLHQFMPSSSNAGKRKNSSTEYLKYAIKNRFLSNQPFDDDIYGKKKNVSPEYQNIQQKNLPYVQYAIDNNLKLPIPKDPKALPYDLSKYAFNFPKMNKKNIYEGAYDPYYINFQQ
uniref:Uncharacterized protein n=1 Tax=Meloidogyne floridensis TaxID=298350 RepID=A0A915PGJ7_9BILA